MDFRPLNLAERQEMIEALRGNAENGKSILMDRHDTRFIGMGETTLDEQIVNAIQSVPVHY